MHVVEHALHGRYWIDVVACDACGRIAEATAAAAGWLHLGPFTPSPAAEPATGLDFCSLECAARRMRDAVMMPATAPPS